MQGSITLNELGIFIVFLLVVLAGGYTIFVLRNLNGLIKEASSVLQKNKDHLNRIIPNIDEISANTAWISEEFKKGFGEAGEAIRTISHETTDTVITINKTINALANYTLVFGEMIKMIGGMFSSSKD